MAHVDITVHGDIGSGAGVLTCFIVQMLRDKGVTVTYVDPPKSDEVVPMPPDRIAHHVAKRVAGGMTVAVKRTCPTIYTGTTPERDVRRSRLKHWRQRAAVVDLADDAVLLTEAKNAKALGLYAASTAECDIRSGVRSMIRRGVIDAKS